MKRAPALHAVVLVHLQTHFRCMLCQAAVNLYIARVIARDISIPCVWSGCTVVNAFLFLQANTVSSVLRTSSMRSIQLERTSSPPTTSCGPSSCHHPVVAWTRRPHTLWREEMLATGRTRSTEWSGGWTEFMVSWGEIPCRSQKYTQLFRCG